MATKFNSDEVSRPGMNELADGDERLAVTFIPQVDYNLEYVVVSVKQFASSPKTVDCVFELYLADVDHKPTGGVLSTLTRDKEDVPNEWDADFTLTLDTPIALTALTEYSIVLYTSTGVGGGNELSWERQVSNDFVSTWSSKSADAGSTWGPASAVFCNWFQAWGTEGDVFTPPATNLATLRRLVAASNNKIWYET
jgi:hypothetical protein